MNNKQNPKEMLREFFQDLCPSVKSYHKRLKNMPREEECFYPHRMFYATLCGFNTLTGTQQTFLRCLIKRYPQEYLDYLFEHTVMKDLRCEVHDPVLIMHFIELIDKLHRKKKFNRRQMLFAFLRSFFCRLNYNSAYEMLRLKNKRGEEDSN